MAPSRYRMFSMLLAALLVGTFLAAQAEPPQAPGAPPPAVDVPPPAAQETIAQPAERDGLAVVIVLEGIIDNYTRDGLFRRMSEAREMGADTVIIRMNTPGGLVSSGLDISRHLKRTTGLHVIVFVNEMALSAGTMIAIAAHEIVMEPIAMIGDAAPIAMVPGGGVQTLGETERAKAEGPVLADFRHSARVRGYSELLAESMVSVGRVVHWVERIENDQDDQRERRFVAPSDYEQLIESGQWRAVPDVSNPVIGPQALLTLDSDMARMLGFASQIAESPEELAYNRGYTIMATLAPTFGEGVIAFLGGMTVRALLMTIFMFSLYMSFSTPGQGIAEAVALTSLGVLLGVPLLTGYAQWWEVVIILIGLALIALELFVIPGFGLAGITGILLMLAGFVMTFVPPELPELPGVLPSLSSTWAGLQTGLIVTVGGLICSLILWVWLGKFLPRTPYLSRLILTETVGGDPVMVGGGLSPSMAETLPWPRSGMKGRTVTDLRPGGSAEFLDDSTGDTRVVDVVSDSGFIRAGHDVIVRRVEGSRVVVKAGA